MKNEQYFHGEKINVEDALPLILDTLIEKTNFQGYYVNIMSVRLQTFTHNLNCVECKRKGTHFRVQGYKEEYHLGLWSDDGIEMTKDHIIPKRYGGHNTIDNMQTMCAECNCSKGSSFEQNDFIHGKGSLTYNEAVKMRGDLKEDTGISKSEENLRYPILKERFPEIEEKIRFIRFITKRDRKDPYTSNKELEENFYRLDQLMVDEDLRKAYKFLSKQNSSRRFRNRRSNRRKK